MTRAGGNVPILRYTRSGLLRRSQRHSLMPLSCRRWLRAHRMHQHLPVFCVVVHELRLAVPVIAPNRHAIAQRGPCEPYVALHPLGPVKLGAQIRLVASSQRGRHGVSRRRLVRVGKQAADERRRRIAESRGRRVEHDDGPEGDPRAEGRVDRELRLGVMVAEATHQRNALHRDEPRRVGHPEDVVACSARQIGDCGGYDRRCVRVERVCDALGVRLRGEPAQKGGPKRRAIAEQHCERAV
mmetsp:Transcript_33325/g.106343  ORF Transcript_33325/g.106343 Transcript_33325/m.106343 type:complete len:241 (-) Transcript_33325:294-1016(-)